MRRLLFIAVCAVLSLLTHAQGVKVKSLQADFTQTKTVKMLGEKMVAKGKMYYGATDKLHWQYTTPYTYTFVMNGQKVMLKKGTRKDVIDTSRNKMFREIGRIMMSSVVVTGNGSQDLPLSRQMKTLYKRITVHFNAKTHTVERVVMYEKNGDTTEVELHNVTLNKPINATLFHVEG